MSTMRVKNKDGTWDKVPVLGSYQAVLAANEAATNAQNAAANAQSSANYVDKKLQENVFLADNIVLVDGKICMKVEV